MIFVVGQVTAFFTHKLLVHHAIGYEGFKVIRARSALS
jgi:hypothetical protein